MAFFQNTVLDKFLKVLDRKELDDSYAKFKAYFHNPAVQENIRCSKEEQFQEGFLISLFVNILGYTINPAPNFIYANTAPNPEIIKLIAVIYLIFFPKYFSA